MPGGGGAPSPPPPGVRGAATSSPARWGASLLRPRYWILSTVSAMWSWVASNSRSWCRTMDS